MARGRRTRAQTARGLSSQDEVDKEHLRTLTPTELRAKIDDEKAIALATLVKKQRTKSKNKAIVLPPSWTNDVVKACHQILEEREREGSEKIGDGEVASDQDDTPCEEVRHENVTPAMKPTRPSRESSTREEVVNAAGEDNDLDVNEGSPHTRRPGPLSKLQLRECADMLDGLHEWIERHATDWRVDASTIAHALGLHNDEQRRTSLWNMFQIQFYMENKRQINETIDDHRNRCKEQYAIYMSEGVGEEIEPEREAAIESWKKDLMAWWEEHKKEKVTKSLAKGERYKKMVDLRKELCERAAYLSLHWQIEIVGFVVCASGDDEVARAASFAFAGSDKTRNWWNIKNIPTARTLNDLETLCRGEELKSREDKGILNIGITHLESTNRGQRDQKTREHLLILLNNATNVTRQKFPWSTLATVLIEAQLTLKGWPRRIAFPRGASGSKRLGSPELRVLMELFDRDRAPGRNPDDMLRYERWSQDLCGLHPGDPRYQEIPLVVADNGDVLLGVKEWLRCRSDKPRGKARQPKEIIETHEPESEADADADGSSDSDSGNAEMFGSQEAGNFTGESDGRTSQRRPKGSDGSDIAPYRKKHRAEPPKNFKLADEIVVRPPWPTLGSTQQAHLPAEEHMRPGVVGGGPSGTAAGEGSKHENVQQNHLAAQPTQHRPWQRDTGDGFGPSLVQPPKKPSNGDDVARFPGETAGHQALRFLEQGSNNFSNRFTPFNTDSPATDPSQFHAIDGLEETAVHSGPMAADCPGASVTVPGYFFSTVGTTVGDPFKTSSDQGGHVIASDTASETTVGGMGWDAHMSNGTLDVSARIYGFGNGLGGVENSGELATQSNALTGLQDYACEPQSAAIDASTQVGDDEWWQTVTSFEGLFQPDSYNMSF